MASIRTVAKEAGVSIATVSRVLNSHTSVGQDIRKRVLHAANKLGYISTVGKRATTYLAFAYTGPTTLNSPYDAMLLEGISRAMDETDFDLAILSPQRDKKANESYSQFFMRKGVRGAILRTTASTRGICQTIAEEGFPSIVVGGRPVKTNMNYAYGDSLPTSRQAIEHLISLGHRRIGIAMGLVEDADHLDRLAGYQQALAAHGIETDPMLIYRVPPSRPNGAQLILRALSAAEPPTALFITDPYVVIGAINQAHRLGIRIPQDLSIIGFDDGGSPQDDSYPLLTAVCQDALQIGHEASAALKRLIDHAPADSEPIHIAMPTWLEIHETTAPPPADPCRILPDGSRIQVTEKASR